MIQQDGWRVGPRYTVKSEQVEDEGLQFVSQIAVIKCVEGERALKSGRKVEVEGHSWTPLSWVTVSAVSLPLAEASKAGGINAARDWPSHSGLTNIKGRDPHLRTSLVIASEARNPKGEPSLLARPCLVTDVADLLLFYVAPSCMFFFAFPGFDCREMCCVGDAWVSGIYYTCKRP